MYAFLDIFFTALHLIVIFFNLLGWIHPKTQRAHLLLVALTLFSWVVLGFYYGFGYCFLTDWQFDVLYELGHRDLPHSFITFFFRHYLHWQVRDQLVIDVTLWTYVAVVVLSLYVNFIKRPFRLFLRGSNKS